MKKTAIFVKKTAKNENFFQFFVFDYYKVTNNNVIQ